VVPLNAAESVYKLYSPSDNQKKLYGLESQIELWVVMIGQRGRLFGVGTERRSRCRAIAIVRSDTLPLLREECLTDALIGI
jgi:hypothetical protein